MTADDVNFTISQIKQRSRSKASIISRRRDKVLVVLLCFDDVRMLREFAIKLQAAGMDTPDFVYIFPDTDVLLSGKSGKYWRSIVITLFATRAGPTSFVC